MRALRLYKPGDLRFEEAEKPSPQTGEVLLKIMAVGICGSDIPRINQYGAHISPIIPGHEFSARIEEIGEGVEGYEVGGKVTVPPLIPCGKCKWCKTGEYSLCENYDYFGSRRDGAFAQYLCSPANNLLKLSDKISYEDAATIDPCANAMHALHISNFTAGESIAVYGVGAIGLYILQCAKAMGAKTVISVVRSEEKAKIAMLNGADYTVNTSEEAAPKKIYQLTDGGADVVVDASGSPEAQIDCLNSATKLGRIVFLGISHKGLNLPENTIDNILRKQLRILGSWNSFSAPFPGRDWTTSVQFFEQGKISSKHVISHRLPLEAGPEVFRQISNKALSFTKVLFFPWGTGED